LKRLSPSLAVALVALFLALGGVATAASHYLITSTKQISPNVLKKLEKAGPRGAPGSTGAAGAAGAAGTFSTANVTTVQGNAATIAANGSGESTASCSSGVAIGGGYIANPAEPPLADSVVDDGPASSTEWEVVIADNSDGELTAAFTTYVICAQS